MAYDDRTFVRVHPVKVSLSEYEHDLICAAARYMRKPPAAYIRELVMDQVERSLHSEEFAPAGQELERTAQ